MENALILLATVCAAGILLIPRLANAPLWRATVTPLASIIGSGFLVLGPILVLAYGGYAPLAMAMLCLAAWAFGASIRFNIRRLGGGVRRSGAEEAAETLSAWVLVFAYVISVAYYLNLFGAFAVSLTPWDGAEQARLVTTAVFLLILVVGWARGFAALERLEQVSVGLKLAIIAGLLAGLAVYFGTQVSGRALIVAEPGLTGWPAIATAFGLIVTVQGFETSRYLGAEYDPDTRVRSMRLAQLLSAAIYLVYIGLLTYAFDLRGTDHDETAIIGLMAAVAPVLPVMLVAAALAAQFSAAVADTSGSGGLLTELSGGRITPRLGYALLVAVGIALTWTLDIFEIISYASRAFAGYYALQSLIAAIGAGEAGRPLRDVALHGILALLGAAIAVFGLPVE